MNDPRPIALEVSNLHAQPRQGLQPVGERALPEPLAAVEDQLALEQQAQRRQKTQGGARLAAPQRLLRGSQPTALDAPARGLLGDRHAELAQGPAQHGRVIAVERVLHLALAGGERGEDQRALGLTFGAGHADPDAGGFSRRHGAPPPSRPR